MGTNAFVYSAGFGDLQEVSENEGQQCFPMTILIGILCQDGVVVGSDSSATFIAGQQPTIQQKCKKIEILSGSHIILAGTGDAGLGQRFSSTAEIYFANSTNAEIQPSPSEKNCVDWNGGF